MPPETPAFKRPESVLVLVYTDTGKVLLLKRRDRADFWQSVTGSLEWHEAPLAAAVRELREETGLDGSGKLRDLNLQVRFPIFPEWRRRYAPGVEENLERAYAFRLPNECPIQLSEEHTDFGWFDRQEAAAKAASWSNRDVIERLASESNG